MKYPILNAEVGQFGYSAEKLVSETISYKDGDGPWEPSCHGAVVGGMIAGLPGVVIGAVALGGERGETTRLVSKVIDIREPFLLIRSVDYKTPIFLSFFAGSDESVEHYNRILNDIAGSKQLGLQAYLCK